MKKSILLSILAFYVFNTYSQSTTTDSASSVKILSNVTVIAPVKETSTQPLPNVKGTYIFAAGKSQVINLKNLNVNVVDNNPRQLFSKFAGVYVYENDGTGNQVNISSRGLTAHRSWEMNVRHNDVMTNSDIYGYPASHFNAPSESIDRIEITRGSAALQYGAQFGGMVNYITRQADSSKKFQFETQQSAGSYGLFSTYNAIGGNLKRIKYYSYFNYRRSDGYRSNSNYDYMAGHADVEYALSNKINLRAEYNAMHYINHINGGLTDTQFNEDPRQSTRKRNYYSPTIYVPSVHVDYNITSNTAVNFISSAVLGSRNSVQFIALSNLNDTINTTTGKYNPRQVDVDHYNSYANELRLSHNYKLFNNVQTFVAGIRYVNNDLHRQQGGKGTSGIDYDLSITDPVWGRDLHFKTKNISVFAEQLFTLTKQIMITAGGRLENGDTKMTGTIKGEQQNVLPSHIPHRFLLAGFGVQYHVTNSIDGYLNWTQAYRPVIFADIIPPNSLTRIDDNIKDAYGYNGEIGVRGNISERISLDINFFRLKYNNKIGSVAKTDNAGNTYIFKTNVGNSVSQGIEFYIDVKGNRRIITSGKKLQWSVFTAGSAYSAKYVKGSVAFGGTNVDVKGNKIEAAPSFIMRNGCELTYRYLSATLQLSYVSKSFADALNTVEPNASGTIGLVSGYTLADANFSYHFNKTYNIKMVINNIFDKQHFTERPSFFPGPGGLYPSDGRSFIVSFGAKF